MNLKILNVLFKTIMLFIINVYYTKSNNPYNRVVCNVQPIMTWEHAKLTFKIQWYPDNWLTGYRSTKIQDSLSGCLDKRQNNEAPTSGQNSSRILGDYSLTGGR